MDEADATGRDPGFFIMGAASGNLRIPLIKKGGQSAAFFVPLSGIVTHIQHRPPHRAGDSDRVGPGDLRSPVVNIFPG